MKFPDFARLAAPAPAEPTEDNTPVETASYSKLVEALLLRIEAMMPDEKTALARQLEPVLPFPKPPPVTVPATNSNDREALKAALDSFVKLEDLGWKIWREIAPQGAVKKEGDLKTEALEYFRGKNDILPQMKATMSRDRMVIGSLLAAINGGPPKFASDFYDTFSPDNIMALLGSNEKKCWLKYVELARQDFPIAPALGFKIKRKLAEFAEDVMKQS